MEKVKISFLDLVNVLSEQEMKKVTGGCGFCNNGQPCVCYCKNNNKSCCDSKLDCEDYCGGTSGVDWSACD